jgi:hypothetical protein
MVATAAARVAPEQRSGGGNLIFDRAERAAVGVGQDGFGPVFSDDRLPAGGYLGEGVVPRDPLELA